MDPANVSAKFEVRSFTRSWDNWGCPKIWEVPGYVRSPFSPKFYCTFVRMDPVNVSAKFEVSIASPIPEIIAFGVSGGGCEPQSYWRGGHRESGIVPFERALVSSYRPSIVTFPLALRVSEILSLLCSSTPLFPTPPPVSSKIPHVPLKLRGWPLGNEEQRCWDNCPRS